MSAKDMATSVQTEPASAVPATRRRVRFQFSLRGLIGACILAGSFIIMWQSEKEVDDFRKRNIELEVRRKKDEFEISELKDELRNLRIQLGHLDIQDKTKVYVRQVSAMPNSWAWRV